MQNIGQTPLAAGGGQQVLRNIAPGHQGAQHRHDAALLPRLAVAVKLLNYLVPGLFILVEPFNILGGQAKHPRCQSAAQRALSLGRQHRLDKPQQLLRLWRLKDAVAVGEVHRRNVQQRQGVADQRRLVATTHQYGYVGGLHRPGALAVMQQGATLLTRHQPVADLRRAELGHKGLVVPDAHAVALHQPQVHSRLGFTVQLKAQGLVSFRCLHRHEGDLAEHKGVVHLAKQRIHAVDHAGSRTPVGIERIVSADFPTRFHVGEDVRAAKGVDRLLGIANQQQRGIRLLPPDAAENTVLLGIGILKLIDHRDRKTLADRGRQRLAVFTVQRLVETAQHVIKAQLAATAFLPRYRLADLPHGGGQHQIAEGKRLGQQPLNGDKQRVLRHNAARLGARG